MMLKKELAIILFIQFVSLNQGFSLIEAKPKSVSVKEGSNVTLSCFVDDEFESCTFWHNYKKCKRFFRGQILDCKDYHDRIKFSFLRGNF